MMQRNDSSHRNENMNVSRNAARFRARLCMALSATLLLPAIDATAGAFKPTGYSSPDPIYKYDIYEWRDDPFRPGSLPVASRCNESTAPIVVLFHGGTGEDHGDVTLNRDMPPLARRLAHACVRFMAIQGRRPITDFLVRSDRAFSFADQLADRMVGALGQAAQRYPNTTNIVLFSGSFGGVTGAALMRKYVDVYTNDANAVWNKLDRFILNVPAGDTCNPSPIADFSPAYVDASWIKCDRAIGQLKDTFSGKYLPENYGYISATPFSSGQISNLYSKAEVHLLVGSNDPIAGSGYAAWGMNNYLHTVGLTPYSAGSTYNPAQVPALSSRTYRITHTVVTGPVHENLWTYNDNVRIGLCQLMARSFRNANSTTDDRDTRNMTDEKLTAACRTP